MNTFCYEESLGKGISGFAGVWEMCYYLLRVSPVFLRVMLILRLDHFFTVSLRNMTIESRGQ